MVLTVEAWKKKAAGLKNQMNTVIREYRDILNDWEAVRDEAGDPGKHDVDNHFQELSNARSELCALRGGARGKKRVQRSRKNRR